MKKHIYTFLLFLFSLHIFSQSDTLELEGLKYDLIAKINNQAVDFDVALSSLETMSKSQYDIMSTQLLSVGKSLKENQLITESLANKLMSSESKVSSTKTEL